MRQVYVEDVDDGFAASAIQAIGTCAQRVPQVAPECLQQLTKLLQSKHGMA
jgi:AP-3 complex subunit beta